MRIVVSATLLGIGFLLAGLMTAEQAPPVYAQTAHAGSTSSSVALHVSVGYENVYRDTAWVPIRVALHNRTAADISGIVEMEQSGQNASIGSAQSFHGAYQAPIVLPAGGTKHVVLYVPGTGVQGEVQIVLRHGNSRLASATAYPLGIDKSTLLVGVMAGSPGDVAWVPQAIEQQITTRIVHVDPQMLDPVPQSLAAFDIIVLSNADTSQLDSAQLDALHRYVQNGGTLLEVGGPAWQETLRPLGTRLVPGRLVATRPLADLHGLYALGSIPRPRGSQAAVVSLLSHPRGMTVANQGGVPLVVRDAVGQGAIEYLAFDPALNPVQSWRGASVLLRHLVAGAAPLAVSRTWSPQGFRSRFRMAFSSLALTGELSNLPPLTLPLLAIFAVLTLVYVLVIGPANFLILRWTGHQQLAWITIPALALSYVASAYGVTTHFRSASVLLNSVGMVTLDGTSGPHPATFYLGLVAPLPGDYHLTYNAPALADPIPQLSQPNGFFWRGASTLQGSPLGMRLQEGTQTDMTFVSMKRWAMRDVTLDTTVNIPGRVQSNLGIDAQGDLVGAIHNGTNLDLLDPVIVAGQNVVRLPNVGAGQTVRTRVEPSSDGSASGGPSIWSQLYGGSGYGDGGFGGFGSWDDGGGSFAQEKTLLDRLRNATSVLSQEQTFSGLGQIVLAGWSVRPLGTFKVDGSVPQRRDLTLLVMPLSVHFPSHGPFQLRPGTLAGRIVDLVPKAPQSSCCNFAENNQQISVGPGGSVTFEFDTPNAQHIRFTHLAVSVSNATEGTTAGYVYDWQARRWVYVDLSNGEAELRAAQRFVSPGGQVMLKLAATQYTGTLSIDDPNADVQLSGSGEAL